MRTRHEPYGFNRFAVAVAVAFAVMLVGFALSASAIAQFRARSEPDNFVQWRTGLASSAQPDRLYLERVKQLNYEVVINLAPPQSHGSIAAEAAIVGNQGLRYVNVPVDFEKPTLSDFKLFSELMRANTEANVLVHCQANLRASSFIFLYLVIHERAPVQETAAKLTGVWVPNRVWKQFIDDTLAVYGKKAEIL